MTIIGGSRDAAASASLARALLAAASRAAASANYTQLSKTEHEMIVNDIKIDIPKEIPTIWHSQCCIYKVPEDLRLGNPKAYSPQFISIGPIYYKQENLKLMETQKQIYFHFFWKRLAKTRQLEQHAKMALTGYKSFLEGKEQDIRHCYSEQFPNIEKEEFVNMIFLDSIFIMELFLRKSSKRHPSDDYMLSKLWLAEGISLDLILLENQIPILVLKELYKTVVPVENKSPEHPTFVELAREYFSNYDFAVKKDLSNWKLSKHFTDLLRYFYIPSEKSSDLSKALKPDDLKSATELKRCGIRLKAFPYGDVSNVDFQKGELPFHEPSFIIPQLTVVHSTERVLRNLIALEQCHYRGQPHVSNYVSLLDALIEGPEDVDLLVKRKILVHPLGSDKVIGVLVSNLSKDIATNAKFNDVIDKVNKHYNQKWHRAMAKLKLEYFHDIWRGSSTIVGLFILFFTFYGFYRSFVPSKPNIKLFTM